MQLGGKFKLKVRALSHHDHLGSFLPANGGPEGRDGGADSVYDFGEEMATFLGRGFGTRREGAGGTLVLGEDDAAGLSDDELQPWKVDEAAAADSSEVDADDQGPELDSEISQKVMNLEALQRIASRGIPWGGGMRALVWKLLLGYLPEDRDSWDGALVEKREAYAKLRSELILNPSESGGEQGGAADGPLERREIPDGDHPLCLGEDSIWHRYFQDAEIATQIDRDLERTHPNSRFFAGDSKSSRINRESMRSILLLFAKLNPAVSYVQGMNEVLAPLFYVFSSDPDAQQAVQSDAEADSFFCFVSLLSNSVDHFCPHLDNSPKGILSTLADLSQLLKANDEELWRHLELFNKVRPQFYAFRWITLLLTQEFGLPAVIRIWDALLGNPSGVQEMLLRVCCAMLLCVRRELLEGDFMANVKLLQSYPRVDLERLLNVAGQVVTPQSRGPT